MRSFFAKVEFTDATGKHPAGTVVNVPYTTDEDIANAQGLIRYGVITEQAPPQTLRPNEENVVVLPPVPSEQPVVLTPNDENAVDASQPETFPTPDDPQTPEWDARNEDGTFAAKEEVEPEEAPKPPAKKATRRKR